MMICQFLGKQMRLSTLWVFSCLILYVVSVAAQENPVRADTSETHSYKSRYEENQSRLYSAQSYFISTYLRNFYQSPDRQMRFDLDATMKQDYDFTLPVYPELHRTHIENEIIQRTGSGSATLLISPMQFLAGFKDDSDWKTGREAIRTGIIPSNLQLSVLKSLWENSEATGMQLYAGLDKEYPLTAEGFNLQMRRMMELGLVERKIISPQNLFMIFTPLKTFQIEQSGLNRRNRLYLYRARIDHANMVRILLDRSYVIRNEEHGSNAELRRLQKKIGMIADVGEGE